MPTILVAAGLGCTTRAEPVGKAVIRQAEIPPPPAAIVSAPAVASPPPAPAPLRVLVGGDLIPHRPSLATPEAITAALAPLKPTFEAADVVVANYEAATGELEKRAFRLAYAAPPSWLAALPGAGIRAVSVANNHACDLDYAGVEATLDAARAAGVTTLGGDPKGDPWQPRVIAERDGKKVCAVAWTTLVNAAGGCAKTVRLAVAPETPAGRLRVVTALQRAHAQCDATVAIIHGGVEYLPQTSSILTLARQAADAGADAVVVHHPHVSSPIRVHATKDGRKVPIFASVGNLVSNQGESWKPSMFPVLRTNRRLVCVNGWTRLGVLADLAFTWPTDGDGEKPHLTWGFHLTWTENSHADDRAHDARIEARLVDPVTDAEILQQLTEDEDGPVSLFSDPCWRERGASVNPRCETDLTRRRPRTIRP